VTSNVFQVGDDEPMESPAIGPAQQPYPAADPSKLLGTEMISVRAGLFRTKHYRYRTAYGERVDYWVDDSVAPIGLIKLEAEQKQHTAFRGRLQVRAGGDGQRRDPAGDEAGASLRRGRDRAPGHAVDAPRARRAAAAREGRSVDGGRGPMV
jgi:hypothetical protein